MIVERCLKKKAFLLQESEKKIMEFIRFSQWIEVRDKLDFKRV